MAYAATIENAKRDFDRICTNIKTTTVASRLGSTAGPVSASGVISYLEYLRAERDRMVAIAAIPGIADAYPDVAAEAGTVMSTTLATIQWIAANLPKSGGKLAVHSVNETTGAITWDSFSSASLAGLRTQQAALEATID